jgi:hypothetical protein
MSDIIWKAHGQQKWSQVCQVQQGDIVVLRLDHEDGSEPYLMFPSDQIEELSFGVKELSEFLKIALLDIAIKALRPKEDMGSPNEHIKLSDRDTKIYLKQTLVNYMILLIGDVRPFLE